MSQPPVVAVVGPTAAGKSDLAVAVGQRLDGEVVNADAMQVYRGMDIGTAKTTPAERGGVPHHLLDILDVTQTATVAEFQALARGAIDDCRRRGVVPVLVGGSALYVRAILDDFVFPGTDETVRARLEAELAEVGPDVLHRRLAEADPAAARQILPTNGRRVVRALEVIEITGGPYVATLPEHRYVYDGVVQVGLDVPRPVLDERIARRVDAMFDAGLLAEVRGLLDHGLRDGRTANRALGYSQAIAVLDGRLTEAEARERTIQATRRFARRQDSWFRKDPRIGWLPYDAADLAGRVVRMVGNRAGPGGVVEVNTGPADARG
jgi:tRNA dimethylallyltransferase